MRSHRNVTRAAIVGLAALACALVPGGGALAASNPTTSIDGGPADGSYVGSGASATFMFSASGGAGAPYTFSCQLDAASPVACGSGSTGSFQTGALSDGPHTFTVTATDSTPASDPSPPSRTWTVDTTNPAVNITSPAADGTFSASASPSLGFSATDANLDTVKCSVDGGSFSPCTSPFSPTGLTDASHTVQVQATDKAGNQGLATRSLTVDTTAPLVNITSGPAANAFSALGSPSFGFTASDTNLDTVQCSLDGGGFSDCTSPYAPGPLTDGSHTIVVRATDKAGNATPVSRTWSVDTTPPVTTDDAPSGWWNQQVTVTLSPGDGAGSGVASTTYSVDNGPTHSGTSVVIGAPSDGSNDGVHTIKYFSTDQAGNVEATKTATVSIDTTAPTTTDDSLLRSQIPDPPDPSKRNKAVTLTRTDTGGSDVSTTYSVDGGSDQSGTSVVVPTPADHSNDLWHTITYHSVDSAQPSGNVEATHTTYEYVDTTAPDTAITAATVGGQATFSFQPVSGSDPDDASGFSFQCSLVTTGSPSWSPCTSPFSQSGLQGGDYTFSVRALDGAGNADATPATWMWTSTPGAADTTLLVPGTVTTDPGTGATAQNPNVDSAQIPIVAGSSGALVANALAAASGQGTDVGIGLDTPIAGVDCPANWKCFDPKTIVFSIQQNGSVVGTPVYTFTLTVDVTQFPPPPKLKLSGVKIFHDGVNVPVCNSPHPKTPAPGPICILRNRRAFTVAGGDTDWQFQLITTINGRVRM